MSTTSTLSSGTGAMVAAARQRQYMYGIAILVIFGLMWPYSDWLQSRKKAKDLGEATIGQVDTGGFMLKLAMIGGFRGMVANYLWTQARGYEKVHEWDKLKGTVEFITKLQPHFLSIWTYQGWNLAYNVSVEWDAPEDKYVWIKNGINFLKEGVLKNEKSADLLWDTAWTYYHKIGYADEAILLRRLFYDDPDDDGTRFRDDPIEGIARTDNFQLSNSWFTRATRKVAAEGGQRQETNFNKDVEYVDRPTQHKGRPGDLAFWTMPAHAQTRYAGAMEKQSVRDLPPRFGGVAINEWRRALSAWKDFGDHEWPAFRFENEMVQIDNITDEKRLAELSPQQKYWTDRWAHQTNYRYWKDRAMAESENVGVDARQAFYEGRKALIAADFPTAAERYRAGMTLWEGLLKRHKFFELDDETRKETKRVVRRYLLSLKQSGDKEPEDYPFKDLMKGVQEDLPPDPFDQLEMTRSSATSTITTPKSPAKPR
jgi:hypothetical protein